MTFEEINPDNHSEKYELMGDHIMAIDSINIGPAPIDEDCAQVGSPEYHSRSRRECVEFISQIRRELGNEPVGARLRIVSFHHDFGTYREVVCEFDPEIQEAIDYAYMVERETPESWDNESNEKLREIK